MMVMAANKPKERRDMRWTKMLQSLPAKYKEQKPIVAACWGLFSPIVFRFFGIIFLDSAMMCVGIATITYDLMGKGSFLTGIFIVQFAGMILGGALGIFAGITLQAYPRTKRRRILRILLGPMGEL